VLGNLGQYTHSRSDAQSVETPEFSLYIRA
jgi:hypothetical protein